VPERVLVRVDCAMQFWRLGPILPMPRNPNKQKVATRSQPSRSQQSPPTTAVASSSQPQALQTAGFFVTVNTPSQSIFRFTLRLPNGNYDSLQQAFHGNMANAAQTIEKDFRLAFRDPSFRILSLQQGSIILSCLSEDIRPTAAYLSKHNMTLQLLGGEEKTELQTYAASPELLTFNDAGLLSHFIEGVFPKPMAIAPPPSVATLPAAKDLSRTREGTASEIELVLSDCVLGKPSRFEDEVLGEFLDEKVAAVCLAWKKEERYLRILVTDTESQIVGPDVPPGTLLLNNDPNLIDHLCSLMKALNFIP